jgi:hypothetical protein
MRRGRKPIPASEKAQRGTFRQDRDAHKLQIVASNDGPVMPVHMHESEDESPFVTLARSIWVELHPMVTAMGVSECDSALFARYCFLEADARALMVQGVLPSTAKMTQLRQMEELLRIAGPKSRVGGQSQVAATPTHSSATVGVPKAPPKVRASTSPARKPWEGRTKSKRVVTGHALQRAREALFQA